MGKPTVSVIMGVYNQWDEQILLASVHSILNQTYKDFEFIIWDDGSHPEAGKLLRNLVKLDKRIMVAGKEENRGLAFSLNECIRLARGKYIARMDSDDISEVDRLRRQVAFLECHEEYGWCGCSAELFDEHGIWGVRKMPEKPEAKDYLRFSPFIHPSVMFRASLFEENRGYLEKEETLRCEDYEIFLNLYERGIRGYNFQETLFCYREPRSCYKKRTVHFRINEARIRYRNFKKMGFSMPIRTFYSMRPLLACLLPYALIMLIKRIEGVLSKSRMEDLEVPGDWNVENYDANFR